MNDSEYYVGDVTDKVIPCPFCGERDAALFCIEGRIHDWFHVQCVPCGARGPSEMAEETAIASWNWGKENKDA